MSPFWYNDSRLASPLLACIVDRCGFCNCTILHNPLQLVATSSNSVQDFSSIFSARNDEEEEEKRDKFDSGAEETCETWWNIANG